MECRTEIDTIMLRYLGDIAGTLGVDVNELELHFYLEREFFTLMYGEDKWPRDPISIMCSEVYDECAVMDKRRRSDICSVCYLCEEDGAVIMACGLRGRHYAVLVFYPDEPVVDEEKLLNVQDKLCRLVVEIAEKLQLLRREVSLLGAVIRKSVTRFEQYVSTGYSEEEVLELVEHYVRTMLSEQV